MRGQSYICFIHGGGDSTKRDCKQECGGVHFFLLPQQSSSHTVLTPDFPAPVLTTFLTRLTPLYTCFSGARALDAVAHRPPPPAFFWEPVNILI